MKLKVKNAILGVLATSALIGAGSAVWKFAGSATESTQGTVIMAGYELIGGITIGGEFSLTVDEQPYFTNTLVAKYDTKDAHRDSELFYAWKVTCEGVGFTTYFDLTGMSGDTWGECDTTEGVTTFDFNQQFGSGSSQGDTHISFKDGQNPTNKDTYDALKTAMKASDIKITVKFSVTTADGNGGSTVAGDNV